MSDEKIDKAREFLETIERKIDKWNERSCFTVLGVKDLSRSDMDDLILYTEHYIKYGYFMGLREPLGSVAEVLKNAGIHG